MRPREYGLLVLIGMCICLWVNTWLAFNARRLIEGGIRRWAVVDVLGVSAVVAANGALWWAVGEPLFSALVLLPFLAPYLLGVRRRDAQR